MEVQFMPTHANRKSPKLLRFRPAESIVTPRSIPIRRIVNWLSVWAVGALLIGCGGGGGGGSSAPTSQTTAPTTTPLIQAQPTKGELNAASRFASRASLGMNYDQIRALSIKGHDSWLEEQFALPVEYHDEMVADLIQRTEDGEFDEATNADDLPFVFRRYVWWHRALSSNDVLRQRIAFALSEIFVVSEVGGLGDTERALPNFYDVLLARAFGNYRSLLRAVTLHPSMGFYLSHVNNRKADPDNNIYPDENFARENMQLFSIGLYEMNPDGSYKYDANGDPIPTYTDDDIREFAKVFTGLSWGGENARFGRRWENYLVPMEMFDEYHEQGTKKLLNGFEIPAGQTGMEDIEDAIDNIFNHANVGPFIGRQLIQRLVTSNPSPQYVRRVAEAFVDNGLGVRGDMKAVIRAVLLDPEATADPGTYAQFGKLREPILRIVSIGRQFHIQSTSEYFFHGGYWIQDQLKQHPLSSPSVFNFFLPSHMPNGEISEANLVAPEFQITTNTTVIGISNLAQHMIWADDIGGVQSPPFGEMSVNLHEYSVLATDLQGLIDRLDIVLTYGTLSEATRNAIGATLVTIADPMERAQMAIYLFLISPDFAVML
jgi:uncharacterized protein (DUF1800 family)